MIKKGQNFAPQGVIWLDTRILQRSCQVLVLAGHLISSLPINEGNKQPCLFSFCQPRQSELYIQQLSWIWSWGQEYKCFNGQWVCVFFCSNSNDSQAHYLLYHLFLKQWNDQESIIFKAVWWQVVDLEVLLPPSGRAPESFSWSNSKGWLVLWGNICEWHIKVGHQKPPENVTLFVTFKEDPVLSPMAALRFWFIALLRINSAGLPCLWPSWQRYIFLQDISIILASWPPLWLVGFLFSFS